MAAKILVVDDSITIQKIVAMAFEKEDAAVEGVGNGSEALVKLKNFNPDIVLADVNMPGLNGFELSKKIKESSEFKSVSVLLLTSDFEDFNEDLFQDSQADDHITKPFKSEDIVQKVKEMLDGSRGSDAMEEVDEDENIITLSPTDQVEDETVVELGKDQITNASEDISTEEEDDVQLELSDDDMLILLEDPEPDEIVVGSEEKEENENTVDDSFTEDEPELAVDSSNEEPIEPVKEPVKTPEQTKKKVPEETFEELIRRVEALSKKSEEIHEQRAAEELEPLETLDEMIKEVSALKKGPTTTGLGQEGNGVPKNSPPPDSSDMDTMIAEVNYLSEENADELEAAFNAIIRGNLNFPASFMDEESEPGAADSQDIETAPDSKSVLTDLKDHPFASAEENRFATEEDYDNSGEFQDSHEEQLAESMGKEVGEIIEQPLTPAMEKEIARLSKKIIQSVEKIIREMVPSIAQTMIEKEIEKIKNRENG